MGNEKKGKAAHSVVLGMLDEWKELRCDVRRLFVLLRSIRKELAEIRKILKEGGTGK